MANKPHSSARSAFPLWLVAAGCLFVPLVAGVLLLHGNGDWRAASPALHSAGEAAGGAMAITLAMVLVARRSLRACGGHLQWLAAGLMFMGLLDVAHAAAEHRDAFVWYRSTSNFFGGGLFALVWLPESLSRRVTSRQIVVLAVLLVVAVLVLEFGPFSGELEILTGRAAWVWLLNGFGGLGFVAAGVHFAVRHGATGRWEDYLFSMHCALFGSAALVVELTVPWNAGWWMWHGTRVTAYLLALWYTGMSFWSTSLRLRREMLERLEAEATLSRSESQLHAVLDSVGEAIITSDLNGTVIMANQAALRIWGVTRQEMIGRPVEALMPEEYRDRHTSAIARFQETRVGEVLGARTEQEGLRADGTRFPMEIHVVVTDTAGEYLFTAAVRDITDRVVAERERTALHQQLLHNERLAAVGATAATFAHEIGNPLNAMYMNAQLLERRILELGEADGKLQGTFSAVMGEIARLNKLLGEFRSLSRRQVYQFDRTDVAELIEEVLAAERAHHAALGVVVERTIQRPLPTIFADFQKLKQVLLNLCKNAAEAMSSGGTLRVTARGQGEGVAVSISDTGGGVDDGVDVFEPFQTTKTEGTGLGLAVVRQIVAAHGGDVNYVTQPGMGTTFTVQLPVTPPPSLTGCAPGGTVAAP